MSTLDELHESIIVGNLENAVQCTNQAVEENTDPINILNEGMIPAMDIVGKKFQDGEYFVPEMLMAARAMKGGMEILKPLLKKGGVKPKAKVLIGTVSGDLHDIGKNLVAIMLEGGGFEVIDAGVDVSANKFLDLAESGDIDILGLSALLTTTREEMKTVIDLFQKNELRDKIKIIVGGAPINDEFAQKIGADGYSPDAASAVQLANSLL